MVGEMVTRLLEKESRKEDPLPSLAKFPSLPSTTLPETIGASFSPPEK